MRQRRARELCKHGDAAALKGDEGLLPATKAGACRTGQVQRCSEGCSKFTPAAELRARRPPSEGRKSSGGFHREVRTCSKLRGKRPIWRARMAHLTQPMPIDRVRGRSRTRISPQPGCTGPTGRSTEIHGVSEAQNGVFGGFRGSKNST